MTYDKFFRAMTFLVAVPVALAYWPAACANRQAEGPAAEPQSHQQEAPDSALPVGMRNSTATGILPHPAFAYAGSEASATSIADIAEKTTPSVVSIASKRMAEMPNHPFAPFFFGPQGPKEQSGLGSGVIISDDGVVLTNHHVIEKATEIKVTTSDDREFEAELVGSDEKSDLAVLRLKGELGKLQPLTLGNSSELRLGDIVLAIGNPFGVGQTVTMGIVSAKGRADVGITDYEDFIQTDAAINPGNSGGALVNMRGELVGINTAILSRSGGYQGIGFAIPTSMARPIMGSLLEHGKVVRGFLGIGIQELTPDLKAAMGLSDSTRGVLVTEVHPDSAASKAGLQLRDVVLKVDGVEVDSTGRLRNLIAGKGANVKVVLQVNRSGKRIDIPVKLGELPEQVASKGQKETGAEPTLGMKLAPLDPRHRQRFRLPQDEPGKVVIVAVAPESRASKAGLSPGDILVEIDGKPAGSVAQAETALKQAKGEVLVVIRRGGANRFVVLK